MPSHFGQEVKIITYKDKNGNIRTIMISKNTGYLNVWINGNHFYRNDFAPISPYPTIQGNTYEAHYNLNSQQAQNISVEQIMQDVDDRKPKQTIVIRRKKK